jgi:hypothetical protein
MEANSFESKPPHPLHLMFEHCILTGDYYGGDIAVWMVWSEVSLPPEKMILKKGSSKVSENVLLNTHPPESLKKRKLRYGVKYAIMLEKTVGLF